jgi:DNA repair exonuclease SbcCD ATPase subunit
MTELLVKSLRFRNFLSYGDYVTQIEELDELGPALIIGEIADDADEEQRTRSNGAGKSNVVEAIIWCLFGRTNFKDRPADRVINWYTGQDCYVEIELCDGTTIRRTRNMGGKHSDLLVRRPDGKDISSGTNPKAQEQLQKDYDLDFDIFTSSVFFGQFGKPFLELSDPKRRKALENLLHLSHIGVRAEVAKGKYGATETEQDKLRTKIGSLETESDRTTKQIERNRDSESNFEVKREERVRKVKAEIDSIEERYAKRAQRISEKITEIDQEIAEIPDIDVAALKKRWDMIAKVKAALDEKKQAKRKKEVAERVAETDIVRIGKEIKKWEDKAGEICPECKQEVMRSHVMNMTDPQATELEAAQQKFAETKSAIKKLDALIEGAEKKIEEATPDQTVKDAQRVMDGKKRLAKEKKELEQESGKLIGERDKQIEAKKKDVEEVRNEQNPYGAIIQGLQDDLKKIASEVEGFRKQISQIDTLLKHMQYVRSAYHDKKKIKAFLLSDRIPFLNERIAYYFDAFGLDFELEFDSYLQKKLSNWDYEFKSGGERKRIDLSVMFALHDLHEAIYGSQCNLLVFDEVDGRLDESGVYSFLNVLFSNFVKEQRPILVVSHKDEMRDAFPTKICVSKRGRFSYIEEIR